MASQRPGECGGLHCAGVSDKIWYCVDCGCWLCAPCWGNYPPHTGGRKGRDGLEHEKTKYKVYRKLEDILTPTPSQTEIEEHHSRDLDSTWFGIRKDSNGRPLFADYDVYSMLMGNPLTDSGVRLPQLASFIGQTNAGKSTLIKMLIKLNEQNGDEQSTFPSPVVGSIVQNHMPTSADVHLYADPKTYNDRTPLLYADCEGFEGGEKLPIGAIENRISQLDVDTSLSRLTPGRTRKLEWANSEEKKTRGYVVKQLYPRILYTFSDVVVFVLRNAKTFEATALRPLLEWGAASLEKSVNQPTLPHAIIALNTTELGISNEEWEVRFATDSLLEANKDCLDRLNGHPFFYQLADQWKARGRTINTILDLIHCYYSTFKVVRIPVKGRYQLLHDQVFKLHEMIAESCDLSFETKQKARMLSTSDELNVYIQSAFDHFAKTLETPFNFVEVSLKNNPIPDDFGGHILQLAIAVQSRGRRRKSSWIFEKLHYLVASSVMLDCVRHRKGLPDDLFTEYEDYFHYALEEFCDLYAPCEFRTMKDHCVNVASTHNPKGHQNSKGKIIAAGHYTSKFRADRYYPFWRKDIKDAMTSIHRDLQDQVQRGSRGVPEEQHLLKIHSDLMDQLYETIGSAGNFLSHSTCFCCLMQAPQHTLPCGHVLCSPCIRSYGKQGSEKRENKFVFKMECCPLHPVETRWRSPCVVRFKPDHAGVRLLCLDGGGIRGIVELEVLRAIQKTLGDRIPIRAFFDLIVGTSTGGIISLGFGVKNWELRDCSRRFVFLCGEAFSPRKLQSVPIMKHMVTLKHAAKYETTPLRNILQATFGQDNLFGSNSEENTNHAAKVAVTATDEAGKRAIILANYSRKDSSRTKRRKGHYDFPRPDNPELELKIWEAAAATSAAPSYFKPFVHGPTKRTYLDGALYHNNPVRLVHRERKLLWPDVADKHPDILLSIGTGQNEDEIKKDMPPGPSNSRSSRRRARLEVKEAPKTGWSPFPKLRQMFKAMHNRMDNILDAEMAWREFCWDVANLDGPSDNAFRYVRINPNLGHDPPSFDDSSQLKTLQEETRKILTSSESLAQIERVAHTLVASSFYYERTAAPRNEIDMYSCSGRICCRFEDGSPYLRALGDYLRHQQTTDFMPHFEIENDADQTQISKLPLLPKDVAEMRDLASFAISTPDIRVQKRATEVTISLRLRSPHLSQNKYPISGFPRAIMAEQSLKIVIDDAPPSTNKLFNLGRKMKEKRYRASTGGSELDGPSGRPHASMRSVSDPLTQLVTGELDAWGTESRDSGKGKERVIAHELPTSELPPNRPRPHPSRRSLSAQELPGISERLSQASIHPQAPAPVELSSGSKRSTFNPSRRSLAAHELPGTPERPSWMTTRSQVTAPVELSSGNHTRNRPVQVVEREREAVLTIDSQGLAPLEPSGRNDGRRQSSHRQRMATTIDNEQGSPTTSSNTRASILHRTFKPSVHAVSSSTRARQDQDLDRSRPRQGSTRQEPATTQASRSKPQRSVHEDDVIRAKVASRLRDLDQIAEEQVTRERQPRQYLAELPTTNAANFTSTSQQTQTRTNVSRGNTLPTRAYFPRPPSPDDDLYSAPPRSPRTTAPSGPRGAVAAAMPLGGDSSLRRPTTQQQPRTQYTAVYPPSLVPQTQGLRSVPSNISVFSDDQSMDYNSTLSDDTTDFDSGFEERQMQRARRMPSAIWSDAQQSSCSDYMPLGRRNL